MSDPYPDNPRFLPGNQIPLVMAIIKRFALRLPNGVPLTFQICLEGPLHPETGMVANLKDVKDWIGREVLPPLLTGQVMIPQTYGQDDPLLETLATWLAPRVKRRVAQAGLGLKWLRISDYEKLDVQWQPDIAARDTAQEAGPMYLLTRRYEFSASHRLFNPEFDEARNWEVFYECNNPNGHGHNYEIEVILTGEPDPGTGMLINLLDLDRLVNEHIIKQVDHKHLNYDVPMLADTITTAENVARVFFEQIAGVLPEGRVRLYCVRVHESRNNAAEYYGAVGLPAFDKSQVAM